VTFATAAERSLDDFLAVSAVSQYQPQLRAYAESLLERWSTRPEWCLLGLDGDRPAARAALWASPGQAVPTDVVLIETDWSELSAGRALLARLHDLARELGSEGLSHHVDGPPAPPQYQENEEERVRLLEDADYGLLRDGLRWRYAGSQEAPPVSTLVFRSLPDVGEDVFVSAIASTYPGTPDSWLKRNIDGHGLRGAAQADFRLEQEGTDHPPEWWELAYTEDGELAGVIMPARNPSAAVIAYVGVVPERRGRGLAQQLIRRGTQRLIESGVADIRGDCDRDNVAMVKAFARSGFEQFARRRSFYLALA
jgi:ribosomal protein S18 acetylase RimI-like enzyme